MQMDRNQNVKRLASFAASKDQQDSMRHNTYSFFPEQQTQDIAKLALKNENLELEIAQHSGRIKALRNELHNMEEKMANFDNFFEEAADFPILQDFLESVTEHDALPAELANYIAEMRVESSEEPQMTPLQLALMSEENNIEELQISPRSAVLSTERISALNSRVLDLESELSECGRQADARERDYAALQKKYKALEEYTREKKRQYADLKAQHDALVSHASEISSPEVRNPEDIEAAELAVKNFQPIVSLQLIMEEELTNLHCKRTELLKMSENNAEEVQQIKSEIERIERDFDAIAFITRHSLEFKNDLQPEKMQEMGLTELFLLLEMQAGTNKPKQNSRECADVILQTFTTLLKAMCELNARATKPAAQKAISQIEKLARI